MTDPTPTPEQQADLEAARLRLRNAKEELADRIRLEKAAEREPTADNGARPLPSIPLGQRLDEAEDRIAALEERVQRAGVVVRDLIREFRAAGIRPKPKPKPATNGKPSQPPKEKR